MRVFTVSVGESDFPKRPVQCNRAFRSYYDNDNNNNNNNYNNNNNNNNNNIYPGSPLALAVISGAFQIINDKMTKKKSPTLKIKN